MREHDSFLFWSINLLIFVAILCAVILNPIHKKNIEKKPVDRTKIVSTMGRLVV